MNSSSPGNPLESSASSPREVRVGELLNEFLDLRAAGTPVPPADFLARHAEYAADLSRHFDGLGLLDQLGAFGGDGTMVMPGPETPAMTPRGGKPASGPVLPKIDGYDVLREIGRGGMGIVYKAVQQSTRRVCALKLLIEGHVASDSTRKRFEREIALSASLTHQNIVPIYDSGEADGHMYYAMEYVHGQPLTTYARERKLNVRQKLALFAEICQGVSHAHQRGVIHRDLKPSNVLVDGDGVPHIYDFGLGKAGSVPDVHLSVTAQVVGTPAYMSPEQVVADPGGTDTRTDVYSLGVILFELLTEQLPYPVTTNIAQTFNSITHVEPSRPSKINAEIDGEVETIVLKALAKAKEERYQSVAELEADVNRYLAGDPIQARGATFWYLARKALARKRMQVALLGLLLVVMLIGLQLTRAVHDTKQLSHELQQREQKQQEDEQASTELLETFLKAVHQEAPEVQQRMQAAIVQAAGELAGGVSRKQPLSAVATKKWLEFMGQIARPAPRAEASAPSSEPAKRG